MDKRVTVPAELPHEPAAPPVRTLVAIALGVLVFLLQISIGAGFPHSIDASWGEVLDWGVTHGAQWGRQLVFTYGPLGFVSPGIPFDPSTYWWTLGLQVGFGAVVAWLVAASLQHLPIASVLAFAAVTVVTGWSWSTSSTLMIVYPLAMLAVDRIARTPSPVRASTHAGIGALAAFVAIQPLVKFSVFPLWIAWCLLAVIVIWQPGKRRLVLALVLGTALGVLLAWLACGQHLANLGAFYATSWQVASGYAAAMQADPARPIADGVAAGATLFGLACIARFAWRARRDLPRVAVYLTFAATLGLAYKAGITRAADGGHLMLIWSIAAWCTPLVAGMWYRDFGLHARRHAVATFLFTALALSLIRLSGIYPAFTRHELYGGHASFANAAQQFALLAHPDRAYRDRVRQWQADRAALSLPLISHTVGNDTVDLLTNDQGALLANGLHYRPRPVFQSYSAYSGKLARMNGIFFRSPGAPQWVILNWQTIDAGFPTADDPLALLRVLQDYRPLLTEGDYLLFRHEPRSFAMPVDGRAARELPVRFGNATNLPIQSPDAWFARLDVSLTPYGKLKSLLLREPKLKIEVGLKDGTSKTYTLTRAIARSGFMLSPALDGNVAYLQWLRGDDESTVSRFKPIQATAFNHRAFTLRGPLKLYPLSLPRDVRPTLALYGSLYPGFNHLPATVSGPTRVYTVDDQPVTFLPAPGTMTFDLPPGAYDFSARYGLMPNALTTPACLAAHADGIGIRVTVQGLPDAITAAMNPFADPKHAYAATLTHRIAVRPGEQVTIALTDGPAGSNGACDWSWIRDVHFRPVSPP